MKRLYTITAALPWLLVGFFANAQPILHSQHAPRVGDVFIHTLSSSDGVSIGSDGPNQVWDFSQLDSLDSDTTVFLDPEEVPWLSVRSIISMAGRGLHLSASGFGWPGACSWQAAVEPVKLTSGPFPYAP